MPNFRVIRFNRFNDFDAFQAKYEVNINFSNRENFINFQTRMSQFIFTLAISQERS